LVLTPEADPATANLAADARKQSSLRQFQQHRGTPAIWTAASIALLTPET
jgi:hypothetical protein